MNEKNQLNGIIGLHFDRVKIRGEFTSIIRVIDDILIITEIEREQAINEMEEMLKTI